jgi:hypothetical protein
MRSSVFHAEKPKENSITEVTRRTIIDHLTSLGNWSGRLSEDAFLARLYDLTNLPSNDYRFKDAAGDIRQHRIINLDWEDDWVFFDPRFNLLHESDENLLHFLCETVHPVVRPDTEKAQKLVNAFNRELEKDGWRLSEIKQMSGKPIFGPQKTEGRTEVFEEPTGWPKVDRQIQEIRLRLETASTEEHYQTVGLLCREVLITVAQQVYNPERHKPSDGICPSATDAKRMLENYFEKELCGGANEEARIHAKAALRLALALQHKRTANFQMAALCAEGTLSVINILAVLAGRRSRTI